MRVLIRPPQRHGFTLIELLVVIAIIAVLGGLTLVVVTAVYKAQAGIGTEASIQKVASELDRQWKAVIDSAKEEFRAKKVPQELKDNYGANPDLARRIWVRMRLEQEFPTSIAEVAGPTAGVRFPAVSPKVAIPAKRSYTLALQGQSPGAQAESSACLLVALGEGRRGTLSNLEEAVGVSAIKTFNGSKVVLDSWGQPIAFRRIPQKDSSGNASAYDLLWEVYSAGPDKQYGTSDDLSSLALRQQGARGDQGHD